VGVSNVVGLSGKTSHQFRKPMILSKPSLEVAESSSSLSKWDRRSFLMSPSLLMMPAISSVFVPSVLGGFTLFPEIVHGLGEGEERMIFKQKPTAPLAALIPAMQQRLLLEASIDFCTRKEFEMVKQIISPLDESNDYMQNSSGNQNLKIITQYNPAKVLRGDLVRATMNLYQTNLNYNNILSNPNDAFIITDPVWKKSFIRENGGLPDLQRVIGADLDMRQLLRNQVQLKIDDATAELYSSNRDEEELLTLLQEAGRNFDLWIDRVRTGDVRDALESILTGKSVVKVYDSYAAGFLPPPESSPTP